MAQLSVSWSNHLKNIGHGLSALQQNSEFVDMTLAADGHFVKVHQLVMAVSSPYIKNLIAAAACPHPIIYLSKISHTTLCSILEYIYTGEVTIALENLSNLLETAKELHIKGLEDMDIAQLLSGKFKSNGSVPSDVSVAHEEHLDVSRNSDNEPKTIDMEQNYSNMDTTNVDATEAPEPYSVSTMKSSALMPETDSQSIISNLGKSQLQYTVSNRGSIQLILNRFIYYLKYTNKHKLRQWRCVEYINHYKCPAIIVTKDEVVLQRISAHSHPFHDKRILKKVRSGSIFSALDEAESKRDESKKFNKTIQ